MPDNVDVTRDQPPAPQAPTDPNIRLPESAKRAIEAAEAAHAQAYAAPAPAPEPVVAAPPLAPTASQPEPAPAPAPAPAPQAEPTSADFASNPDLQGKYDRMVQSMNGRLKQRDDTIQGMNDQLQAMGGELQRLTVAVEARGNVPQPVAPTNITEADREFAGDQMLDLVRKVAAEVVAPVANTLQTQQKQQARSASQTFYAHLDQSIPEWRDINRDPLFKSWLRLQDVYSGTLRQTLLNNAVKSADGPRAEQFFKGFKSEQGHSPSPQPAPEPQPAPQRQAATTLEALAAPGRASPAGSQSAAPAATEKPIYTRQDISNFYAHKRLFSKGQGYYAGKKAEMDQTEADIIRAQGERRIQG